MIWHFDLFQPRTADVCRCAVEGASEPKALKILAPEFEASIDMIFTCGTSILASF
jgi:hypothetical protein